MITLQIILLSIAISVAEGWNAEVGTLTYRNHNPGALRYSPFALGRKDGFAVFTNDMAGFFALTWDLAMKCHGETRTKLGPKSTLQDLINVYTAETDPTKLENYTKTIERITGKDRHTKLEYFHQ